MKLVDVIGVVDMISVEGVGQVRRDECDEMTIAAGKPCKRVSFSTDAYITVDGERVMNPDARASVTTVWPGSAAFSLQAGDRTVANFVEAHGEFSVNGNTIETTRHGFIGTPSATRLIGYFDSLPNADIEQIVLPKALDDEQMKSLVEHFGDDTVVVAQPVKAKKKAKKDKKKKEKAN